MHMQVGRTISLRQGSRPLDLGFWGTRAEEMFLEGSMARAEAHAFANYAIASHIFWWGGMTTLVADIIFLGSYADRADRNDSITQGVGGGLLVGAVAMDLASYYLDAAAMTHLSHAVQYHNEDVADAACGQATPRIEGVGLVLPKQGGAMLVAKASF